MTGTKIPVSLDARDATSHSADLATDRTYPTGQCAATSTHSSSDPAGQDGIVTANAARGESPCARNWNDVPTGIVRQRPGANSTTSSKLPARRHVAPRPPRMYQISSTVRWRPARETASGGSSKCAALPEGSDSSSRTCDPSGAVTVGSTGSSFVPNPGGRRWPSCVRRSASHDTIILARNVYFRARPPCGRVGRIDDRFRDRHTKLNLLGDLCDREEQ